MTTSNKPESALAREIRLFDQGIIRLANAYLNRFFDLSPRAASRRFWSFILLFFVCGFLLSLINYPLNLWLARLQDVFYYSLIPSYRASYVGNPISNLIAFAQQVFLDPRNLRLIPLLLAPYFISLQYAAIYLADIFELKDVSIARKHIGEVALSGSDETIRISKGEIAEDSKKSPNILIGGPGKVIVDLDSAVLFERPDGTPHVIGPTGNEPDGKATIEGFERFREAIDLRDHFIDLRDQDEKPSLSSVKSRSSDGIPVMATDVRMLFSIFRVEDKPADPESLKVKAKQNQKWKVWKVKKEDKPAEKDPYPFSRKAVENIIYKATSKVMLELPNPSTYEFSWTNNMVVLVRAELGKFMNQHRLTEYLANIGIPEVNRARQREDAMVKHARRLVAPSESPPQPRPIPAATNFIPRPDITNLFAHFTEKFTNSARDRGVELRWIGVGTWKTPVEKVINEHLEAWKLNRDNQGIESEDAINTFNFETMMHRLLGIIQDIPIGSYHQALAATRNHRALMRTVLVDYRRQLIQAKDLWIHQGEPVPQNVEEAIRRIEDVLGHFVGRDSASADDVVASQEGDANAEPEVVAPGPRALAYAELVRMVAGDGATANRLIEYERSQFPNEPLENLVERAIERLARDRQS